MVNNPAIAQDLVNRSLRPLSDQEISSAQYWLDDAWTLICTRLPSVPTRLTVGNDLLLALVVQVECAAVLRYFANPEGVLEEHGDDAGRRFDSAVSAGALYITDDELEQLGLGDVASANAFTIMPTGTAPDPRLRWPKPDWA